MSRRNASAIDLHGLDALRGALAVYVLIGHARWLLWTGHSAWMAQPHEAWQLPIVYGSALFRYGREAVLIFFALSGFFIHLRAAESLRGHRETAFSLSRYFRRRSHRLAPTYYLALAVTVVCDLIGRGQFPALYAGTTGDALLDGALSSGGYAVAAVLPSAVMLPSSLGISFGSNGPLWSLGYEVAYYALYPIWLAIRRRSAVAAFAGVPIVCLAIGAFGSESFVASALNWYPVWLCGAALVEWCATRFVPSRVASVTAFAAGLAAYLMLSDTIAIKVICATVFAGAAIGAWMTIDAGTRPARLAEFLGRRSYSIYVLHFPILVLLSAVTFRVFGARPMHGWIAVGGTLVAIAACVGLFHIGERHFLHERLSIDPVPS